jgi:hypothetical protein
MGEGHRRNNSTDQTQGQSLGRLHTESRMPLYAGPLKGSPFAALCHNVVAMKGGTGAMAYEIPANRITQRILYISFRRRGERRALCHTVGRKICCHHEPLLYKFLQMALCNSRSPVLLCHGSWRKQRQHSLNSGILPYFLFFLSLFLFVSLCLFQMSDTGKEVRRELLIV